MTKKEAGEAFRNETPVICNHKGMDVEYQKISAVIFRKEGVFLELLDRCGRSVSIVTPAMVRVKE